MVKIELASPIKAEYASSGTSASGNKYAYAVVKAEGKDKKQIKIWANNPDKVHINNGDYIKISNLTTIAYGAQKNKDGFWQDTVTINADIERMESEFDVPDFNAEPGEFADLGFNSSDDTLPF